MSITAAILDVDGVLLDTATLHEAAWKAILDPVFARHGQPPFTSTDYRTWVDGQPRSVGLSQALSGRGIALADGPRAALAEEKDRYFLALLGRHGARVFPDATAQLHRWRRMGLRLAFVSASRNAGRALRDHGLDALAEVLIDGEVARREKLVGKRDILREAARRIGVEPAHALVVEDAVAGIDAAGDEGFALIIGLDRAGGAAAALRAAGAHRVARSLSALDGVLQAGTRLARELPSALRIPLVEAWLGASEPALYLEEPVVHDLFRRSRIGGPALLQDLARRMAVGVVSDRDPERVRQELGGLALWVGPAPPSRPEQTPIQVGWGEPLDTADGIGVLVGTPRRFTRARLRMEAHELPRFLGRLRDWHASADAARWTLRFEGWLPDGEAHREALCTLGNGVFATRGAAEESAADGVHYPGTYVAGGYNKLATVLQGKVQVHEDLVNWPNWLVLSHRPTRGAWFALGQVRVQSFEQVLDLRAGVLRRTVRYEDHQGRTTTVRSTRLVSMDQPDVAAIRQELVAEDWSGELELRSGLDGTVTNRGVARYRGLRDQHLTQVRVGQREGALVLDCRAQSASLQVAMAARTRIREGEEQSRSLATWEGRIEERIGLRVTAGAPICVEKVVVLRSSRDHANQVPQTDALRQLSQLPDFEALRARHSRRWAQIWRRADVQIQVPDPEPQRILRVHLFHLMQVTSPHTADRDLGVPARGLHGEAYRGHIFWDEIFVFPWLNATFPELTRELLMYRYRRLDAARRLARDEGRTGAAYPWQSGSSGEEESARIHLNPRSGRWLPDHTYLQRHVGAAIAYNVWRHFEITGDHGFLSAYGAEMLLEIARYWASRAEWDERLMRYRIRGVVGPDEFHTQLPGASRPGVDDNAYTNIMAAWCLRCATWALDALDDDRQAELLEMLQISDRELQRWARVASRLRVPFLENGLIAQFDGWEDLQELDWEGMAARHGDIHRLDRLLEAEGDDVNRYKATKQADVLMLFYLFSAQELVELLGLMGYRFDPASIPAHVDYYVRRTSHGSTLSRVVHSWVLARSDRARSWSVFLEALGADVHDVQGGTTGEGIHLGAMAGTVDLVRRAYTGAVLRHGVLWLNPRLPDALRCLTLRFLVRGAWLEVTIEQGRMQISYQDGWPEQAAVGVAGTVYRIHRGTTRSFPLAKLRASQEPIGTQ